MNGEMYEGEKARWRANLVQPHVDPGFADEWPSETRGDGKVRRNNSHTGAAQGKGTLLRKAPCRLCGFLNDLTAIDHSGGSIDGQGAGGGITTATVTYTVTDGTTATENTGTQALRRGSGCCFCFTKNSTATRILDTGPSPWDRVQPLGF